DELPAIACDDRGSGRVLSSRGPERWRKPRGDADRRRRRRPLARAPGLAPGTLCGRLGLHRRGAGPLALLDPVGGGDPALGPAAPVPELALERQRPLARAGVPRRRLAVALVAACLGGVARDGLLRTALAGDRRNVRRARAGPRRLGDAPVVE